MRRKKNLNISAVYFLVPYLHWIKFFLFLNTPAVKLRRGWCCERERKKDQLRFECIIFLMKNSNLKTNEKTKFEREGEKSSGGTVSARVIYFKMLIISLRCACFVMGWKDWAFELGECTGERVQKKAFCERDQEQELGVGKENGKKSKKKHSLYKFSANFIFASNNKFYVECQMEAQQRVNDERKRKKWKKNLEWDAFGASCSWEISSSIIQLFDMSFYRA